jgi:hypothetical protein
VTVKHAFTSAVADGGDAALVRPSNWNANHTETGLEHSDRILTANETLAANQTSVVFGGLYIADGITLAIGDNSIVGLI